jgi:hypothetical protein
VNASILLPNASVLATRSDFDTSTFPSEGPSKRHANYFNNFWQPHRHGKYGVSSASSSSERKRI